MVTLVVMLVRHRGQCSEDEVVVVAGRESFRLFRGPLTLQRHAIAFRVEDCSTLRCRELRSVDFATHRVRRGGDVGVDGVPMSVHFPRRLVAEQRFPVNVQRTLVRLFKLQISSQRREEGRSVVQGVAAVDVGAGRAAER
jgi:hypothetical protein